MLRCNDFPKTKQLVVSEKKGGRPQASCDAVDALREVVADHTAGSPVEPDRLWTNRSCNELADELSTAGFELSPNTIKRLLRNEIGVSQRGISKTQALGNSPDRNEQFERIAELKAEYLDQGWPVVSIDTKKKELLGDFARDGQAWTNGQVKACDHDFPSAGHGKAVPYGVYDLAANEALVFLAEGADTSELAVTGLRRWWYRMGHKRYWNAPKILVLADSGGSNGRRLPVFREQLCNLASKLNRDIRVAHLPSYCSKYNPIDHRLFCHLTRSLRGLMLRSIETLREAFARTTTSTGLRVIVELARRSYMTGMKASPEFRNNETILRDPILPHYNYVAPAVW